MTDLSLPDFRLDGQHAFVTGASSGLGVRFARVLSAAGAKVTLTARRRERLDSLAGELRAQGGAAFAETLDVTRPSDISRAFDAAEQAQGPVSILVNNAGMNVQARASEVSEDAFDTMMATNVKGAFFCATEAGRRMLAHNIQGRIINIASIGAHTVLPGLTVYCMSKAAVAMMTRSLAREWAKSGINVTAICPGYIETELNAEWFASEGGKKHIQSWPRRRLAVEDDLDGMLLLLASPASRVITGSILTVDDGQSL